MTNRKVCIFIPNFCRKQYIEETILLFKTKVPVEDWIIIIGNDNCDEDFSYLVDKNVYFFSLVNQEQSPRNGCFIRNYFIKRCLSEFIIQRDPEILVIGDFLFSWLATSSSKRLGKIKVVDEKNTSEYFRTHDRTKLDGVRTLVLDPVYINDGRIVLQILKNEGLNSTKEFLPNSYFHYMYMIRTTVLQKIFGYDEDYLFYGFEDSDIFCRLLNEKVQFDLDYNFTASHFWHPITVNLEKLQEMKTLFLSKKIDRNINTKGWGEGVSINE